MTTTEGSLISINTSKPVSSEKDNQDRAGGLSALEREEYILKENPNRFVILPIQEQEIWDYYKKAQGSFWKVEEIKNISQDLIDWETKLDSDEKHFIKMVLAFFASTDGIVNENLAARFMTEVQLSEARCFIKGTKISLADGTSKPIERVKIGDRVLGWNATDKCVVPASVTFTKHHVNPQPCVKVTLEDGRTITCTYDHQFLTSDGTFVEARDLVSKKARVSVTCKPKDNGLPIIQLKVLDVKPVGDHEVYDLTIENPINSFVAEGAVVHNCFYGFQIAIENIHGEMYSLLIDTYIKDATEKLFLLRAIHNIESIKALSGWAMKWINSSRSFATRLVAFACVEGIFFSGPFCAIFWLKKRGLMPALTASNEFISRDEALHCEFACLLYGYLEKTRLEQSVVYQIVEEAVSFEKQFITESLPCRLIGMNSQSMCTYIEFCADRLIMMLGYPPLWNAQNPYDFMNNIGLDGKTNFFEKNTTEYSQSGFEEGATHTITLHEDF